MFFNPSDNLFGVPIWVWMAVGAIWLGVSWLLAGPPQWWDLLRSRHSDVRGDRVADEQRDGDGEHGVNAGVDREGLVGRDDVESDEDAYERLRRNLDGGD